MNDAPAADHRLSRLVLLFYLASLALLSWGWFPPFPLSEHNAQWGDAVFAATAVLWAIDKWREGRRPRLDPAQAATGLYFAAAALSLIFASPDKWSGSLKLLGVGELGLLAIITSDIASRPAIREAIARVVAVNSIVVCLAAVGGLLLFYAGIRTRLVGTYGDLVASPWYARAQAGLIHPNLLASYCIFAASAIAHSGRGLSVRLRRAAQAALWITVALTFSRAMLGFVLAALVRSADTRRRRVAASACAVVFALAIVSLSIWNLSLDPADPLSARFDESAATSRWQTVTTSLRTLVANPLFGGGLATSPGRYRGMPFDAHLTPLNIAATMGLPALVAFTSIFVILWRGSDRAADLAIWSGFAGLALDALASDIEDFRHLWVMIGLAAASQASRRRPAS
jgi:hypothetical protein